MKRGVLRNNVMRIFLFICLLLPFTTCYLLLQHQKTLLKQEVKKRLLQGDLSMPLTLLKFSKEQSRKEISWEHTEEFEYLGKMYDVVKTIETKDTVLYWCWEDERETMINVKLTYLALDDIEDNEEDNDEEKELLSFLKKLYLDTALPKKIKANSEKNIFSYTTNPMLFYWRVPPFLPPELT